MWWGIANNITDPLVRVFKAVFGELSTFQASLIQFAFYGGYFCMAIPGAVISRKFSYKTGVLVGLGLYALGCFLLYPSTLLQQFVFFCISAFSLLVMLIGGIDLVRSTLELGQESSALRVKVGYVYLAIPISGFFLTLYAVIGLVERIQEMLKGKVPPDEHVTQSDAAID